jgi:hypothetical protein
MEIAANNDKEKIIGAGGVAQVIKHLPSPEFKPRYLKKKKREREKGGREGGEREKEGRKEKERKERRKKERRHYYFQRNNEINS